MRTCVLAYIRTYVHTYIRTYVHTYIHTYVHTYIHRAHPYIYTLCNHIPPNKLKRLNKINKIKHKQQESTYNKHRYIHTYTYIYTYIKQHQGCGIQGFLPTSVIQVGIPLMKKILFGVRPFLLYHRFVDSIPHSPAFTLVVGKGRASPYQNRL